MEDSRSSRGGTGPSVARGELSNRAGEPEGRRGKVLRWEEAARGSRGGGAFRGALHNLKARERSLAREARVAPGLFAELEALPPRRRRLLAGNGRRFRNWALTELVIDDCHRSAARDPEHARELGKLAVVLAARLRVEVYGSGLVEDMRARAWACLGNARRLAGDLNGAEEAFRRAESHLWNGSCDPLEEGTFFDLKASLRHAQSRFGEAAELLDAAGASFRKVQDLHLEGRTEARRGLVWARRGRADEAIPRLERGLEWLDADREPAVVAQLRLALADLLIGEGRLFEARHHLAEARLLEPADHPDLDGLPSLEEVERKLHGALLCASAGEAHGDDGVAGGGIRF